MDQPLLFPTEYPSSNEVLRDLSNFVGAVPNSNTSYSSVINVSKGIYFSVELKRRDNTRAQEGCASPTSQILTRTFRIAQRSEALKVIRALVACPTWTHGQFVFYEPGLHDLIFETFSLLRSSRSLSTLDIQLEPFYHRHLPTLLCVNPFLKTLILNPFRETLILNPGVTNHLEDAERLALCFSRNSVLKSCTLALNSSLNLLMWNIVLRPFTTSLTSEANVALKELVLQIHAHSGLDAPCEEAIAKLVRCNTTIEKLEVRSSYSKFYLTVSKLLEKALAVNHTLQEFGCVCSIAHLKELVGVFIPDFSGHQGNTHLTTLKLFPTLDCRVADYMKELCRMLELNTTLKHVEVVSGSLGKSWMIWEVRSLKDARHGKGGTRGMLELMICNELRVNTSLQSLVVGFWKLLRVGGEWQMSYGGPCLAMKLPTAEYAVKIKMRQ